MIIKRTAVAALTVLALAGCTSKYPGPEFKSYEDFEATFEEKTGTWCSGRTDDNGHLKCVADGGHTILELTSDVEATVKQRKATAAALGLSWRIVVGPNWIISADDDRLDHYAASLGGEIVSVY